MLFILIFLQALGIADIVFPIMLPIFGGTLSVAFIIILIILVASRGMVKSQSTPSYTQGDYPSFSHTPSRSVYIVPMECPFCKRELELDRVEWRDGKTMVCPGCYEDVRVESSVRF